MISDEHVFLELQKGKIDLFYKIIYPQLMTYAIRHLGPDYAFWAEDCVQEAFYKTFERRDDFSSIVFFRSYLYSCLHNQIINIFRRDQVNDAYLAQYEKDDSEVFLNSIIEQETLDMLYDAISNLPDNLRAIFKTCFIQSKTNDEAAVLLGISKSTVKRQKTQMIEALRAELKVRTGNDLSALSLLLPILSYIEMAI